MPASPPAWPSAIPPAPRPISGTSTSGARPAASRDGRSAKNDGLQHAERLQLCNLLDRVAGVAQHRLRMLADGGRADRGDLGYAVDVEGARHGQVGAIGERHESTDLA